ncbi:MAG: hypothetical protein NTZ52_01845 [Chlamydiae bacterium]|nr:hypothetical protein [Chlamydiota bacterium]
MLEGTEVKGDQYWKRAQERLQKAKAHLAQVPTTLQAELRSY